MMGNVHFNVQREIKVVFEHCQSYCDIEGILNGKEWVDELVANMQDICEFKGTQ